MFFDICHQKDVRYDVVYGGGFHRCRECGRKWYCVIPENPKLKPFWEEGPIWERIRYRLLDKIRAVRG